MTSDSAFEMALKEAKKSLQGALDERNTLEHRILSLKQTIEGLTFLCNSDSDEELLVTGDGDSFAFQLTSLTDSIRRVFSTSSEPMLTPTEVRDGLVAIGVDLSKYKQPLVPIHNTLKRLVTQQELVEFRDDRNDLRGYRWVSPLARAVAEVDRPIQKLRTRHINPGASNRLEQWLRPHETPIDTEKLPAAVADLIRGPQGKK